MTKKLFLPLLCLLVVMIGWAFLAGIEVLIGFTRKRYQRSFN